MTMQPNAFSYIDWDPEWTTAKKFTRQFQYITLEWVDDTVPKAGTLTFTIDGDPLDGENVLDISSNQMAIECSGVRPYVHILGTGIPATAQLRIYFMV